MIKVFNRGGTNKKYIFKDGTFSITPTTNSNTSVDSQGRLKFTRLSKLVIPYTDQTQMVYIKFTFGPVTGSTGAYNSSILIDGSKKITINGSNGDEYIRGFDMVSASFGFDFYWADNNYYNQDIYIDKIWSEDSGGV
ncbi:MAG: hypothetical protein LKF48_07500 [Prevotella sp.]|jgi:hypothetical protein|nr:hypothetical protein [Prevotella sp.]MCH4182984.1 hypothetical protein [Prevotella sp.]